MIDETTTAVSGLFNIHRLEAAEVLIEQLQARIKLLEAVMDAAEPFLARPDWELQDWEPFHQHTTAGSCRQLLTAYKAALEKP